MMFHLPQESEILRRDYLGITNGLDATRVILHWVDGSGEKDNYDNYINEEKRQEEVRALFMPSQQRADRAADVRSGGDFDEKTGDATLVFAPSVQLDDRKGLWFEVVGFGEYTPEAKQPLDAHEHAPLFPNGQKFGRAISVGVKR